MLGTILKGMMIGFAFIAPIGMQNLYVFNNAISTKLQRALLYALFVWLADASFSLAAFFGMGAIISANEIIKLGVMLIGGILVLWIGYGIMRSANSIQIAEASQALPVKKALLTSIIVSWANPQALVDGSLMLGALRGTLLTNQVLPFIGGVLAATFIWFFSITIAMNSLKERLPKRVLLWVNIISAIIVMGYGGYLLIKAILILI